MNAKKEQQKMGISLGFFLLLFLACFAISLTSASATEPKPAKCKDEQGKDVDWFMVYKLPKNRTSPNPLVRAGLAYAYILPPTKDVRSAGDGDARMGNSASVKANASSLHLSRGSYSRGRDDPEHDRETWSGTSGFAWILSGKGIDLEGSMVGQTLGKLYSNKGKLLQDTAPVAFLTYNDQPPVGPTVMSGGHSKGIILTSLASGLWIQHSVPHFPLIEVNSNHYQYPTTGRTNGQIFHCISLPTPKDVDDLGRILEITKPHIANFSFPTDSFKTGLPQLMAIANRRHRLEQTDGLLNRQELSCVNEVDDRACLNEQLNANGSNYDEKVPPKNWDQMEIRSAGGNSFKAFIKGPSFNEEIYSAWIAPTYKTQLLVQTWLNGPNPFPSNCTLGACSVFNIEEKSVIAGDVFSTHSDHSKWAIAMGQPLVCISDLNRMEHQLKRGGVTVCLTDLRIWSTFNSSIIDVQPCPRFAAVEHYDAEADRNASSSSIIINPSNNFSPNTIGGSEVEGVQVSNITRTTHSDHDRNKWIGRDNSFHHRRQRKVKSRTYSFAAK